MERCPIVALAFLAAASTGCVALGWRFGPGVSMRERRDLFAEPPVVEHRGQTYVLTWVQGGYPFFFEPGYQVMGDRLVFALVATASSGNLAGRRREMAIAGADAHRALERGGAFWWEPLPEPRGSLVPITIIEVGAR